MECLFVKIAEQVKRFHADVGPSDAAFQQTPKVFQTVGVDSTVHVSNGVVNDLVSVIL